MTGVLPRSALIGRDAELARLAERVDQARTGRGAVVVISGEPGIGKTALIEAGIDLSVGFDVFRCRGVESEAEVPFSGLHQLLGPLGSSIEALDPTERTVLQSATALSDAGPISALAASMATLTLLAQTAVTRPVLVIIDDLHWIDAATIAVMSFVARRISHDHILLLAATRPGVDSRPIDGEYLTLSPLTAEATGQLIASQLERSLPDHLAAALADATGGNALAVVEAARYIGDDVGRLGTMLDEPIPASELIQRGFADRLVGLPESTREALAVLSTTLNDAADTVHRALAELGISSSALDAAEDAGVIRRGTGTIAFAHPLLRALVHTLTPASAGRRAHAALAAVEKDRATAAWHAASAASVADEAVAARLAAVARDFKTRGGHAAAARALERAAQLSPDRAIRARRLYDAALAARLASRPLWADVLLDAAREIATDPVLCLSIDLEHGILDLHLGRRVPSRAPAEVAIAARSVDANVAADALSIAANTAAIRGDREYMLTALHQMLAMPTPPDPRISDAVVQNLACLLVISGEDPERGRTLIKDVTAQRTDNLDMDDTAAPELLIWLEEYETADRLNGALQHMARESGNVHALISVLLNAGDLRYRCGDWAGAQLAYEDAARMTDATLPWLQAFAASKRAIATAGRGDPTTLDLAATVEQTMARHDLQVLGAYIGTALGLYALGNGDGPTAVTQFERVEAWCRRAGYREPGLFLWQAELADAHLLAGDEATARRYVEELREVAEATGRRRAVGALARLDGILASDQQFESHFACAFAVYAQTTAPFELAIAHLAFGRRLRRVGQRRRGQDELELAAEAFRRLGASAWLKQARDELRALGAAVPDHTAAGHQPQLTSQERAVATYVAQGMTNKQVAAQLYLTPKTIEWHLRQIYRKLGIRSRTQLAAHILQVADHA